MFAVINSGKWRLLPDSSVFTRFMFGSSNIKKYIFENNRVCIIIFICFIFAPVERCPGFVARGAGSGATVNGLTSNGFKHDLEQVTSWFLTLPICKVGLSHIHTGSLYGWTNLYPKHLVQCLADRKHSMHARHYDYNYHYY